MKYILIILTLIFSLIGCNDNQTSVENHLYGTWEGIDSRSKPGVLVFKKDKTLLMNLGGWNVNEVKGAEINWTIDIIKDPMHLDITLYHEGRVMIIPCIFKIINKNKTLFSCVFDNESRPSNFNLDPDMLIMLNRKINK
jgi:hypothetical protein